MIGAIFGVLRKRILCVFHILRFHVFPYCKPKQGCLWFFLLFLKAGGKQGVYINETTRMKEDAVVSPEAFSCKQVCACCMNCAPSLQQKHKFAKIQTAFGLQRSCFAKTVFGFDHTSGMQSAYHEGLKFHGWALNGLKIFVFASFIRIGT